MGSLRLCQLTWAWPHHSRRTRNRLHGSPVALPSRPQSYLPCQTTRKYAIYRCSRNSCPAHLCSTFQRTAICGSAAAHSLTQHTGYRSSRYALFGYGRCNTSTGIVITDPCLSVDCTNRHWRRSCHRYATRTSGQRTALVRLIATLGVNFLTRFIVPFLICVEK